MHGPLHEISLIEVLQLLERGRRSGVLRVVGSDATMPRTLRIHRGLVAAVEPDADDAAVHRALQRRHLLASDDPVEAIAVAERERLREQLARTAVESMMRWTQGRFDFTEATTEPGLLAWSADALVMALVEDESRRVDLADALADWHAVPAFAPAATIAGGAPVELSTLDWRILDAVDGERDVAEIGARLDEPLEAVGGRVRELCVAAILHLHAPPADATMEARGAIDAGRFDEAAGRLRARVRRAPQDAEAWRVLGLAEVAAGRFDAAMDAWTAWRGAAPERRAEADALILAARTMMEALLDHRE